MTQSRDRHRAGKLAAHLRAANVATQVFGEPMGFWRRNMPKGMKLRSPWRASHIADPANKYSLDVYTAEKGLRQTENFPLDGARTLYGATKLAAELLIAEYVDIYGLRAVINRCGVVSGPWQMGYAEQGVFAHWMFAHYFKRPLA